MDDAVSTPHRGFSVVVRPPKPRFRFGLLFVVLIVAVAGVIAASGTGYTYGPAPRMSSLPVPELPKDAGAARKLQGKLATQNKQLEAQLDKLSPSGTYVVVDQTQNRLYLMND